MYVLMQFVKNSQVHAEIRLEKRRLYAWNTYVVFNNDVSNVKKVEGRMSERSQH